MAKKKGGIKGTVAKTAVKEVDGYLATLDSQLKTLKTHIEELNTLWYGGIAYDWYNNKGGLYYDRTLKYCNEKLLPMHNTFSTVVSYAGTIIR